MIAIKVLILLCVHQTIAVKLDADVVKNYSEFFNFGSKKLTRKLDREKYENTIFKSKVDILGSVFKTNVDSLKIKGILDLIFLIDASSSVGEHNFKSELKFVKKLLSDVTVDFNHTRVAVVSFSSQHDVITNIDEISNPKETNNKCLLLNNEISEIKYTGGGTYTLGAFKVAKEIFKNSRKEAKKVLFLITDGFSNGGDPVPVANELKESQVTIFTIGILNGNYKELYELSTEPGELYSYLLDSYEEFEGLARRALHVDLQSGDYIPLGTNTPCNKLCEGKDCCDRHALCTCGTSTGHYSCLCEPGYYGSGLKNSCSPCPSGSYANGPNLCLPCPDVHHYTRTPAIGLESCTCKSGYRATENFGCEVIRCPKLSPPENGYFVNRKECGNVLNTACGVRCNVGYTLNGSSIRLCQSDASWSGQVPTCQVRICKKLSPPLHGSMSCKHSDLTDNFTADNNLPVDTVCSFSCERGRTLVGSSLRTCLPLAQWDGLKAGCKQIKCNKLSKVNFGDVEPKSCILGKQPYGKRCNISCSEGFELVGPSEKICIGQHGNWDTPDEYFCKDVTKPNITCPDYVRATTMTGKPYGMVDWETPMVIDNSDANITVWTKPSMKSISNFKFKIGKTTVTYFAQDASGNKAKCNFTVEIQDVEVPIIEGCIDPLPFLTTQKQADNITWDEPTIHDNSQHVKVNKTHQFGTFRIGVTKVNYTAFDLSNNTNSCVINITVQESKCEMLPDPIFGHSECQPYSDSIQCVVTCEEGYALPINTPMDNVNIEDNSTKFICEHSQPVWYNKEGGIFPECTVTEIPTEINQTGVIEVEPTSPEICQNESKINEIGNEIKTTLQVTILENCDGSDCKVQTEATCVEKEVEVEEEGTNVIKREVSTTQVTKKTVKRKRKKINVKFKVQAKNRGLKGFTGIMKLNSLGGRNVTVVMDKPRISCPQGSFSRRYRCVRCPQGTFHNATSNTCQSCEIGYYNDKAGRTSCSACPKFYSTRKLHAKSHEDCIEQCPPGTFARKKQIRRPKNHPNAVIERTTLKPYCSSCPIGQYQSDYAKLSCQRCPEGYTTSTRGAVLLDHCVPKMSNICNEPNICNEGTCVLENDYYYTCKCNESFIGAHCETKIGPCTANPCQNNAACTQKNGDYFCSCPEGFKGKHCTEVIDKCNLDCKNNATCVVTDDDETICICPRGFGGELCGTKIVYCMESLCENGGFCKELNDGFSCVCKDGYIGHRCTYLPCDYRPCPGNSVCVNLREHVTTKISFRCDCPMGFTGANCSETINFCNKNPCINDGHCSSEEDGYKCKCKKGFRGVNCEDKLSGEYVLNFPRSGVTDFVPLEGFEEDFKQVSVCLWMITEDNFNYGTLLSYATHEFDNAFTITDYTGLVLYVNNNYVVTDVLLNDGSWHHFCLTWRSLDGRYEIFLDRRMIQTGFGLSTNHTVKGKGKLVVGQEQDILGGKFSQSESFLGKIAHLDVYSRILTKEDVQIIMNSCPDKYYGDFYAWPEIGQYIKGDIQIENSTFCLSCPEPDPLYNGNVYVEDNVAFYHCNAGFDLSERDYTLGRSCTKASKWEGSSNPYCKAVKCGHPGYISNGYVIGKGYNYLDEVIYKCNYGFNLTGGNSRICWSNSSWIPDAPTCVGITCTAFVLPNHSMGIVLLEDEIEVPYEDFTVLDVGTQVEVKCLNNSTLEGEAVVTCSTDGSWDFEPPTCKLKEPTPTKIPCSMEHIPKAPINGYMVDESLEKVTSSKSDTVEYKCRRGYKLVGDNSSSCIIDGYWSELKMECKPRMCSEPPKYSKMVFKPVDDQPQVYQIGNMITYECSPGYKAFGNTKLRCLMPGVWSRMQANCIKISCGKPQVKPETTIKGNYLYNDEVNLVCDGEQHILTCGSNGEWIGDPGNC